MPPRSSGAACEEYRLVCSRTANQPVHGYPTWHDRYVFPVDERQVAREVLVVGVACERGAKELHGAVHAPGLHERISTSAPAAVIDSRSGPTIASAMSSGCSTRFRRRNACPGRPMAAVIMAAFAAPTRAAHAQAGPFSVNRCSAQKRDAFSCRRLGTGFPAIANTRERRSRTACSAARGRSDML